MLHKLKTFLLQALPANSFARGVGVLVGGTASAQLLLLLAAPLLTRLYSPEDFGLLAVYSSLLSIICVTSSLRYELAIPLPDVDHEAANVVLLCLVLVSISSLLTGMIIYFFGQPIARALGVPGLSSYFWMLPLGVLLSGAYAVFSYWAIRTKQFSNIAATKLRQAIATLVIQLSSFKFGGLALLAGQVAGQGVGTASLAAPALLTPGFRTLSWVGLRKVASTYRRFPFFSTPGALFNAAAIHSVPLLIAGLFLASAAGAFALAARVLLMPMSLIGSAIAQVFLSEATQAARKEELGPLIAKVQGHLFSMALPFLGVLLLFGPDLFAILFGKSWRLAGEFARLMAPWIFLQFISSPFSMISAILAKEHEYLIWQMTLLICNIAALGAGYLFADVNAAVLFLSLSGSACYGFLTVWIWRHARVKIRYFDPHLIKNSLLCLLALFPSSLALFLDLGHCFSSMMLLLTILALGAYYLRLVIFQR